MFQHEVKNIYIGEVTGWKPWSNTLVYYPLTSDLNDYSWNNHNLSIKSGSVTYSNNMATLTRVWYDWWGLNWFEWDFTMLAYTTNTWWNKWFYPSTNTSWYPQMWMTRWNSKIEFWYVQDWGTQNFLSYNYSASWVHLIAEVKTNSKMIIYVDGVEVANSSGTYQKVKPDSSQNNIWIGTNVNWSWTVTYWWVIVENKARTAQEVANYYNNTKSNYWL